MQRRFLTILWMALTAWVQTAGAAPMTNQSPIPTATAVFAGGCFWCMEQTFETELPGVIAVTSGYTGGHVVNPTYEQVSSGTTGHFEAVKVEYDPSKAKYQDLLDIYWRNIDPTDPEGQFVDKGLQYKSAIFFANDAEKKQAEQSLAKVKAELAGQTVYTEILPAQPFYAAEEHHQDYYRTHGANYSVYKHGSGRAETLKRVWQK